MTDPGFDGTGGKDREGSGVSRRSFLRAAGALAGAAALSDGLLAGGPAQRLSGYAWAQDQPFTKSLRFPQVLTGDRISLVAREASVRILDGVPTRMWTFNGQFPGPTIRRRSGRTTKVEVVHRLPAEAGSLTLHHHGGHQASSEDGQPERNVIAPGGARTYTWELMEDGAPERGALQWYHDHSHYRTSRNVWRGLAGMVILDDPREAGLGLPQGRYELPLMIGDRSFGKDNQLTDPFPIYDEQSGPGAGAGFPPSDDVFGSVYLVNGVPQPYHEVEPRRYRLRILNSAIFRIYNLRLSDEAEFQLVGTESGLLPAPVVTTEVLVGPGERVDVVVDFGRYAGRDVFLQSGPRTDAARVPLRTEPAIAPLLKFAVARRRSSDPSRVPKALRPLPEWVAELNDQPDRVWAFGLGVDTQGRSAWTINGQAFDHHRIDARPELGSTETWLLTNLTGTSHYVHIHDVDWVVLSRNGNAPLPEESGLKETFRIDPGEVVLVGSKFTDHLGPFMLHCHMLQHEDHGMMTTFEVVKPGEGDLPAERSRSLDTALRRDITDEAVQRDVEMVVRAARAGRPAPVWVLARCSAGAARVTAPRAADSAGHLHRVEPLA